MKKLLFLILIHCSAFAQTLFCPPEILCNETYDLDSCQWKSESKNLWDKITGKNNLAGVYKNTYVSAPFYSYDQGYALCVYTHEQVYSTLTLHAKPESNLEMLIQDHEPWHAEESWWECRPHHEKACPLQEQAALMIKNNWDQIIYLSNNVPILPGQFARLYENDLSSGWVDLFDASHFIGRIHVSLDNRLKITGIIVSDFELTELSQIEDFNAIVVAQP